MRHLSLVLPFTALVLASSPARASERGEAQVLVRAPGDGQAGYTVFGPRPLDTILFFLRQAKEESPVAGVRDRLKEILDHLDGDQAVARMVEPPVPDRQHPFVRVVMEPDGRPALEYSLPAWRAAAEEYRATEKADDVKDLTVAVTLHAWGHLMLHHHLESALNEETVTSQESEVWQDMVVNVLAPGRKEHHFLFSEAEDRETYYGLLCFAAADSRLDHPAWRAFLHWVAEPDAAAGVTVCREVERSKSARL